MTSRILPQGAFNVSPSYRPLSQSTFSGRPSIVLAVRRSVRPSVRPFRSSFHPFCLSVCPSARPSVRPSVRCPVRASGPVRPSVRLSVYPSVRASVRPVLSVRPSCLSVHLSVRPSVLPVPLCFLGRRLRWLERPCLSQSLSPASKTHLRQPMVNFAHGKNCLGREALSVPVAVETNSLDFVDPCSLYGPWENCKTPSVERP